MKNNIGLIILALSIVIAALHIGYKMNDLREPYYPPGDLLSKGNLADPLNIRVQGVSSNSGPGNADYHSKLTIGDGQALYIKTSRQSTPIIIAGKDIIVKYHHLAKMLEVEYKIDSVLNIKCFTDALEWGNKN